jgi:hypothetical protein
MAESIATSAVIAISPSSGVEPLQSGFGPPGDSNEATSIAAIASLGRLNDLADVVLTNPVNGQRLRFNGTVWVNVTP